MHLQHFNRDNDESGISPSLPRMMYSPFTHLKWGHQIARDQKPEWRMGGRTDPVAIIIILRPVLCMFSVWRVEKEGRSGEGTDMRYFIHFGSKFNGKCCTCLLPSDNNLSWSFDQHREHVLPK